VSTGFTDDEVRASVDQFLLQQVSVGGMSTGARNIIESRDAVLSLVTTSLLLRPDSYLYLVWLATNRLAGLARQQLADLDELAEQGALVSRRQKKIESTAEITNARAALLEVNAGLNARSAGVSGSISPAVARFQRSISRFLEQELVKNTVVSGQAVETADKARTRSAELWAGMRTRHEEIAARAERITGALSALGNVQLPKAAVQRITQKIQDRLEELEDTLAGPNGVRESRQALLDLITMRTLLAKVASFSTPALVVAPTSADTGEADLVSSPGIQASVLGTVSGPFNYGPGSTLALSLNSGAATPTLDLPRQSNAEIRSQVLSPFASNPFPMTAAFQVDSSGSTSATIISDFSDVAALVDELNLEWSVASVTAEWDAAANQIVIRSNSTGDVSRLRAKTDNANEIAFVEWAFGGGLLEARAQPPTAQEVADSVHAQTTLVDASAIEVEYASFRDGARDSPNNAVWDRRDAGSDLTINTTNVVVSSKNLEALGIVAGMGLEITAPPASVGEFVITDVTGDTLTLDSAVPGVAGVATYVIGPDYREIPDGARVQVTAPSEEYNNGYYRVSGGGEIARLVLDRNIPTASTELAVRVFSETLKLEARGTTPTSGIGVSSANTLGLSVGAEVRASLSEFELVGSEDLLARGVKPGYVVILSRTGPDVTHERLLESVTTGGFTVTEPVLMVTGGPWEYRVERPSVREYVTLTEVTSEFSGSTYVANFNALDQVVGRLIRGAQYDGVIGAALSAYYADVSALLDALNAYTPPHERVIDNVIRTMREQGFDRAVDLFTALDIREFFTMSPEGVSYSSWLVFHSAKAARELAPVTKWARGPGIVQEWRPLSFQRNPLDLRDDDT
jgi:hypothetical protein